MGNLERINYLNLVDGAKMTAQDYLSFLSMTNSEVFAI